MKSVTVCRVCLSDNIKMYCIKHPQLQEIYGKLISAKLISKNWELKVCYICHSQLWKCYKLMDIARRSEKILAQLQCKSLETIRESVESNREALLDLTVTCLNPISYSEYDAEDTDPVTVKLELTDTIEEGNEIGVKEEMIEFELKGPTVIQDEENTKKTSQFYCDICNEIFSTKHELMLHIRKHSGKKLYKCKTCHEYFANTIKLSNHIKNKHPEKNRYSCNKCNQTFRYSSNWRLHINQHLGIKFTCNYCSKDFILKSSLQRHILNIHTGEKPFECEQCDATFRSAARLRTHRISHTIEEITARHIKENIVYDKEAFKCRKCDQAFETANKLNKHNTLIHTKKKCDTCGETFKNNYFLRIHCKKAHVSEKCNCPICGQLLSSKCTLKYHIAKHKNDKPFTCDWCSKKFVLKSRLVVHIRAHTGEQPFTCEKCGLSYSQKVNLENHILMKHTENHHHSCHICGKMYINMKAFFLHLKTKHKDFVEIDKYIKEYTKKFRVKICKMKDLTKTVKKFIGPSCDVESFPVKTYKEDSYKTNKSEESFESNPFEEYSCDAIPVKEETYQTESNREKQREEFSLELETVYVKIEKSCEGKPLEDEAKSPKEKTNKIQHRSENAKVYKNICHICNKQLSTPGTLKRHIEAHSADKRFKCDVCEKAFHQKANLLSHRELHDESIRNRVVCHICNKSLSCQRHLNSHIIKVHGRKLMNKNKKIGPKLSKTSPLDEYFYDVNPSEDETYEVKPNKDEPSEQVYIEQETIAAATKSEKSSSEGNLSDEEPCTEIYLEQETNEVTPESKKSNERKPSEKEPCLEYCSEPETNESSAKREKCCKDEVRNPKDKKSAKTKLSKNTKVIKNICNICSKQLSTRGTLKRHMKAHTEDKTFKCHICGIAFHQKANLVSHMKLHDGSIRNQFVCHICNKSISSQRHLNGHIRRVHTDKENKPELTKENPRFMCKLCKKSYFNRSSLNVHMRVHTGERPFICPVCGLSFNRSGILRRHIKIHKRQRSDPCNICGKTFSQSGALAKHIRITHTHTEEKPFACKICKKSYNRKDTLKRHTLTHLGKRLKCDICLKLFACKRSLQKHMKFHTHNF